jgi:predicted ATPase
VLGLCRNETPWGSGFPYDVPAIAAIESVRLGAPVTLLAGDNGTAKSTLIEAIAEAIGFAAEGGELERSGELPAVPRPVLGGALEPVLSSTKPTNVALLAIVVRAARAAPPASSWAKIVMGT